MSGMSYMGNSLRLSNAFPCQGGYVYFYTVGSQASPGDCRMSGYTLLWLKISFTLKSEVWI